METKIIDGKAFSEKLVETVAPGPMPMIRLQRLDFFAQSGGGFGVEGADRVQEPVPRVACDLICGQLAHHGMLPY